ncbi:MAG: hypothetical protein ACI4PR_04685 [Acutalibacteraceae bacterium]
MSNKLLRTVTNFLKKKPGRIKTKNLKYIENSYENHIHDIISSKDNNSTLNGLPTTFHDLTKQVVAYGKTLENELETAELLRKLYKELSKLEKEKEKINGSISKLSMNVSVSEQDVNKGSLIIESHIGTLQQNSKILNEAQSKIPGYISNLKNLSDIIVKYGNTTSKLNLSVPSQNNSSTQNNQAQNRIIIRKLYAIKNYNNSIKTLNNISKNLRNAIAKLNANTPPLIRKQNNNDCNYFYYSNPSDTNPKTFNLSNLDTQNLLKAQKIVDENLDTLEKINDYLSKLDANGTNIADVNSKIDGEITKLKGICDSVSKQESTWVDCETMQDFFEAVNEVIGQVIQT